MIINPAENLKKYRKKIKKSPIYNTLDNGFTKIVFACVLIGIGYMVKDFILEWFELLMATIDNY